MNKIKHDPAVAGSKFDGNVQEIVIGKIPDVGWFDGQYGKVAAMKGLSADKRMEHVVAHELSH